MGRCIIFLIFSFPFLLKGQCIEFGAARYVNFLKYNILVVGESYVDTIVLCNESNQTHYHEISTGHLEVFKVLYKTKLVTPYYVSEKANVFLLTVSPNSKDSVIIKYRVFKDLNSTGIFVGSHSLTVSKLADYVTAEFDVHGFFQNTFFGYLLIMLLLVLIYYIFLKHRYFLDYTIYLSAVFLSYLLRIYLEPIYYKIDYNQGIIVYKIAVTLQCLFYVGYFSFIRSFLNTKIDRKNLDFLAKYTVWYSLISFFIMIFLFFIYNDETLATTYFTIYRIIIAIIALLCIVISLKKINKLVIFMIIGSTFLLVGALLAMYYSSNFKAEKLGWAPIYYMQLGMMVEFIFFNIGIGYKTYQLSSEKHEVSNKLIESLRENEQLARNKEMELQQKIEEATVLIQEVEKQNLETAYALKAKEMEMQILRSQINPHFMFNTINALKSLTMQHKYEEVGNYFDEFSKLLRLFLENSRSKKIALEKELKATELYVLFENLRMRYKIKLNIYVDPSIDIQFTQVPPTIIQPFVENAIWHGLNPRESEGGEISISIIQHKNENLQISIKDNGIGRRAASSYKTNTDHNSLATKIIEERLALANNGSESNIVIHDLYDQEGRALGTEVALHIEV